MNKDSLKSIRFFLFYTMGMFSIAFLACRNFNEL